MLAIDSSHWEQMPGGQWEVSCDRNLCFLEIHQAQVQCDFLLVTDSYLAEMPGNAWLKLGGWLVAIFIQSLQPGRIWYKVFFKVGIREEGGCTQVDPHVLPIKAGNRFTWSKSQHSVSPMLFRDSLSMGARCSVNLCLSLITTRHECQVSRPKLLSRVTCVTWRI